MSFVASDGSTPQLVLVSPCRVGRSLILYVFLLPVAFFFFSLTEILEQIVAVSTDLWEICHVSCFKQVV